MKVQILSNVTINGRNTALVNYAYFSNDGEQTSAVFQATERRVRRIMEGLNDDHS